MCAISLTVRPNEAEAYENPERAFRPTRMCRIKPVSEIGALYSLKDIEINDISDRQFLDISYDKAMAYICIRGPQANAEAGVASVFTVLGQACIPFTMVSVQPEEVSFVISERSLPAMCDCMKQIALCPEVFTDCTKVSVRANSGQPLFAIITALSAILAANDILVLRMAESYGLIEILTESRYSRQVQQAIEKQFPVK